MAGKHVRHAVPLYDLGAKAMGRRSAVVPSMACRRKSRSPNRTYSTGSIAAGRAKSRYTTQRQEPDQVKILSGHLRGRDHRHADPPDDRQRRPALRAIYRNIADPLSGPAHADYTYWKKYGGPATIAAAARASGRARTASRVAAGAVWARKGARPGHHDPRARSSRSDPHAIDRAAWDWQAIENNPFWCPDAKTAGAPGPIISTACAKQGLFRRRGPSKVVASGVPAGLGEPGLRQARR